MYIHIFVKQERFLFKTETVPIKINFSTLFSQLSIILSTLDILVGTSNDMESHKMFFYDRLILFRIIPSKYIYIVANKNISLFF